MPTLNIVWWGGGGILVEKRFKLYMRIVVLKTQSEISASSEENKGQNRPSVHSQDIFSQ